MEILFLHLIFLRKVTEFMKQYDSRNEQVISREDFVRSLDQLRCNLSCAEVATIMEVFKAPMRFHCQFSLILLL